ncbi:RagB/SusD family nutrient uptake outer membrane protein [Sinomicrobium sp.]
MKKLLNFSIYTFTVLMALTSCSEDFLDDPQPTQQVSENVVFGSVDGVEAFISGIIREGRGRFDGQSTSNLSSYYVARIWKGDDMMFLGTGFWKIDYDYTGRTADNMRPRFIWNFSYHMINQINNLINGVEASPALSDSEKAYYSAKGKALRGFYYFQLALEFSKAYSVDPSFPAGPIYTELTTEGKPMSSCQEMYDLIVSDLTFAVENLTSDRLGKSYVNKQVAAGILARVYLTMENWEGAAEMANLAYDNDLAGSFAPELYGDGFLDINNPEWLWGYDQTPDQWVSAHTPAAWTDILSPGMGLAPYKVGYMNVNFTNLFSATDIRNLFQIQNANVNNVRHMTTTKFWFDKENLDYPIIRKPEMVLIEAEAKFRQGPAFEAEAHDLLYYLQKNRDPNAVKSSNTGGDLEEEILLERRKELYGEIGVEWFDAKRLQRGIVRTSNHQIQMTIAPNDILFVMQVPESEYDANDNIDPSVNNDR